MSLLNISSPALQNAHDGSKSARDMSSAVSPSKGSSSASCMLTRTQLETEKKTLSVYEEMAPMPSWSAASWAKDGANMMGKRVDAARRNPRSTS
eukprot:CAMPEP_0119085920 /NCGR_PEP_ID=MMETSP1178-20130426/135788_1 /TAXON_ID=33656 /ORGANISM="unid sp, Strain CCMP2000" /LENGTH=93 /DNA_ID=CAMNT_0007069015 /DNA_START=106 /DNA_END=384 /DNA_ORIENTATION=-